MSNPQNNQLATKLIHAGEPKPRLLGAVSFPIFQSSTFEYSGASSYHDLKYIRLNNTPNHKALHKKLASIENAEDALVAGSGMAAITTALLAILKQGDHFLIQDTLYGGTHNFVTEDLPRFGISYDFIDAANPDSWKGKLRQNTKCIYVETMSNPLLQVGDLKAIARFAIKNKLVSLIDNTFASPVNFRPSEHGFDLSLHSCTKYLNGHSDIVAGAVIGRGDLIEKITHKLNHLGGSLDPHACFLLSRGMKTLDLRMKFQNESALVVAQFLEKHPMVIKVNYPGLESSPSHSFAKELLEGYSGMISFELQGGLAAAEKFIEMLSIPIVAPSLGGVETLITRPALTSHSGMSAKDRQLVGISDGLIRISIGIEATEDLIEDFGKSLNSIV